MDEKIIFEAAQNGSIDAIEKYAECLIEKKEWHDALKWLRKGAEAGSHYCMIKNAYLTMAMFEAATNIAPAEAKNELPHLLQAERWAQAALYAKKLDNDDILSGTHGIHSALAWCHYLIALNTKNIGNYKSVISRYEMISNPCSRVKYAYIQALEEVGQHDKAIELSRFVIRTHDNTIKDFMLEVLCIGVSQAYFEGKGVPAYYETAQTYAMEAGKYNPNCEIVGFFTSGEAKKAFDAMHQQQKPQGGCYVATCVYGTYDCPQVWTLRRFRDNMLAKSFFGKCFIRIYYSISPVMVKLFGNFRWFHALWIPVLNHMVAMLNHRGVEDTPYCDRS